VSALFERLYRVTALLLALNRLEDDNTEEVDRDTALDAEGVFRFPNMLT
jgi:hypothetical protein